jgi:hypothetical protein
LAYPDPCQKNTRVFLGRVPGYFGWISGRGGGREEEEERERDKNILEYSRKKAS